MLLVIHQSETTFARLMLYRRTLAKMPPAALQFAVPIPLVNRGRGDPRNILGIIVNRWTLTNTQLR